MLKRKGSKTDSESIKRLDEMFRIPAISVTCAKVITRNTKPRQLQSPTQPREYFRRFPWKHFCDKYYESRSPITGLVFDKYSKYYHAEGKQSQNNI